MRIIISTLLATYREQNFTTVIFLRDDIHSQREMIFILRKIII